MAGAGCRGESHMWQKFGRCWFGAVSWEIVGPLSLVSCSVVRGQFTVDPSIRSSTEQPGGTTQVLAVSSAATAFESVREVPPLTLAAWRLQLTSVLLGCGAAYQWRGMSQDERLHTLHKWRWLAGSGVFLAVHFGAWVWGLEHTSLTHSLVFVSFTPVLLAAGQFALRHPVSKGELIGSAVALLGGIFMAGGASARKEQEVHAAGDLASLLAAFAMVGYLSIGRRLRHWMPTFVYAAPVTAVAALVLSLAGLAVEGVSVVRSGKHGVFGWMGSGRHALVVLYLSCVPGIVGHTGFNMLLKHLTALIVALAFQLEPLVGSVIGYVFGVMHAPGVFTYIGGSIVLAATVAVSVSANYRKRMTEGKKLAAMALTQVFDAEPRIGTEKHELLHADGDDDDDDDF
jgi:drug/metabolite transporter (DMT)-like permease